MSNPESPWSSARGHSEVQGQCLNEDFISVSELTIDPENWHAFSPGQTLAVMHAAGMLHGDLHRSHMFFDPDEGQSQLIDFAAAGFNENLDPQPCALDLVPAYMSLPKTEFHAFISGYISISQSYIDSICPGFTKALLEAAGVRIAEHITPRPSFGNIGELLSISGFAVSTQDGRMRLIRASRGGPGQVHPTAPSDFLLIVCGLVLSGIDCRELLEHNPRRDVDATECQISSVLALLYRDYGSSHPNAGEGYPYNLISEFFTQLKNTRGAVHPSNTQAPSGPSEMQPDPSMAITLLKCLSSCRSEIAAKFLDSMIDVVDFLSQETAGTSLQSEVLPITFSLAQLSLMLNLKLLDDAQEDESRLHTILRRSHNLPWMTTYLGSDRGVDHTLHELAFANSRASLLLRAFESSLADDSVANPRWSLIWRCLQLTKQCIVVVHRLLNDASISDANDKALTQITPVLVTKFGATLTSYGRGLLTRGKFGAVKSWSGEGKMIVCLESVQKLLEALKQSAINSTAVKFAFEKLIGDMKIERLFGFMSMILR